MYIICNESTMNEPKTEHTHTSSDMEEAYDQSFHKHAEDQVGEREHEAGQAKQNQEKKRGFSHDAEPITKAPGLHQRHQVLW